MTARAWKSFSPGDLDSQPRQPERKARILCFDDNGFYSFSSLLVLEHIMTRTGLIEDGKDGKDARPCEHFDLICGCGLGGLIAIFLGRLGMSIRECQAWFNAHLHALLPTGQASMLLGWGRKLQKNNDALAEAVKEALRSRGLPEDTPLLDPVFTSDHDVDEQSRRRACRVFVLALHPGNIHIPIRLRSYTSKMDPVSTECCLWEAAVATEASPTYYTPVMLGKPPVPYMASSFGFCNPSREALDEVARIWVMQDAQCLVSLGTGKLPPRLDLDGIPTTSRPFQFSKSMRMIHTMSAIATDTQRVHMELNRDAKLTGLRYFRFEASEGISYRSSYDRSPALQESVQAAVIRYVQRDDIAKALTFCAGHLHAAPPQESQAVAVATAFPPELLRQLSLDDTLQEKSTTASNASFTTSLVPILDSEFIPRTKEQRDADQSADEWLRRLRRHVHPVVEQRRRDNDRKVKIAILDSGLDDKHEDIIRLSRDEDGNGKIKEILDFTSSDIGTGDAVGHGTYCAALLLEVAPNATIYVAKVFDSTTAGKQTPIHVAKAITHAVDTWQVDIIAMAFGFQQRHQDIMQAVRKAYDHGTIMLAAASNDGSLEERPAFPARLDQVICVNSADGLGSSSAFNPQPSIAEDNFTILGEKVESAEIGSRRVRKSGTSVATMIAAGVAALVLELSFQRPSHMRVSDIRSYSGMRAVFAAMSRDTSTYSTDGRYFIRPWKLLDTEKNLEYILLHIAYILNRL